MSLTPIALKEAQLPTLTPKQHELISAPTPKEEILQREGRGGLMFDYVSTSWMINKLNEVFGLAWSFQTEPINNQDMLKLKQIVVKGTLTVPVPGTDFSITKEQFGSAEVKLLRGTDQPVDLANDYKAAASDAMKKCASLFGIASDVYSGAVKGQAVQSGSNGNGNGASAPQPAPRKSYSNGGTATATKKQFTPLTEDDPRYHQDPTPAQIAGMQKMFANTKVDDAEWLDFLNSLGVSELKDVKKGQVTLVFDWLRNKH